MNENDKLKGVYNTILYNKNEKSFDLKLYYTNLINEKSFERLNIEL